MLIQFVLMFILVLALVMTWRRVIQGVILRRDGVMWSVLWIGAGVVVALPSTATLVARVVGIGRGADLVMYISVIILFLCIFKIFILLDGLQRTLTDLVRTEALKDLPKIE